METRRFWVRTGTKILFLPFPTPYPLILSLRVLGSISGPSNETRNLRSHVLRMLGASLSDPTADKDWLHLIRLFSLIIIIIFLEHVFFWIDH